MKPLRFLIALFLLMASLSSLAFAEELKGTTLYTQVNIYSIKGRIVTWKNYKVDTLIPVNTPILLKPHTGDKVYIAVKGTDIRLALKNSVISRLSGKEWAAKHFSETKVDMSQFTALEREGIKNASLKIGMRKQAALVARGFPPHKLTHDLNASEWIYWVNRRDKEKVVFEHNKVVKIINL